MDYRCPSCDESICGMCFYNETCETCGDKIPDDIMMEYYEELGMFDED